MRALADTNLTSTAARIGNLHSVRRLSLLLTRQMPPAKFKLLLCTHYFRSSLPFWSHRGRSSFHTRAEYPEPIRPNNNCHQSSTSPRTHVSHPLNTRPCKCFRLPIEKRHSPTFYPRRSHPHNCYIGDLVLNAIFPYPPSFQP